MAAVMAAVGSVILVISLFDTLGRLRTPDTREEIARFLSEPPGSSLDIEVAQVVDAMRVLAFVSGALAAAALVFAVFVLQRHVGARIGFTVVAALLLVTIPVAGLMPLFLLTAAVLMWSRPARDWYAGRAPQPAPARPTPTRPTPPETAASPGRPDAPAQGAEQQWGDQPAPLPQSAEPSPVAPPPSSHLFGTPLRPEDQPPAAWGAPAPSPEALQPPTAPAWSAPQQPSSVGQRRPTTVTVAAILTWVGSAAVAGVMLLLMAVLASGGDAFVEEFDRAASGTQVSLSREEILAVGWAVSSILMLWSLAAAVLAVMAFRRSQAGRIGLVVSAGATAMMSLLLVLSIVSLVTLFLSVATVALLFMGGANDWYARRTPPAGYGPPATGYGPPAAGHGQQQAPPVQAPPAQPPRPRERPKPW